MDEITKYIAELEVELVDLPQSDKQDVLEFYREFLLDGHVNNRAEIEDKLGTPEELAEKLMADYQQAEKKQQSPEPDQQTVNDNAFSKVQLQMKNTDVRISLGDKYQVIAPDYDENPISVDISDNVLTITENYKHSNEHNFNFNIFSFGWQFGSDNNRCVKITVPNRDALTDINGKSIDGDISIKNLTLATISLRLQDGDINLSDLQLTERLKVIASDGDVKLTNCHALVATITLFDGDCSCDHLQVSDNLNLNMADGDIKLYNSQLPVCSLKIGDGDTKINQSKIERLELNAGDGDLVIDQSQLSIIGNLAEGDVRISQSQLMDNNKLKMVEGDLILDALTDDLNYRLSTPAGDIKQYGKYCGQHLTRENDSQNNLTASTFTGDIILN